MDGADSAKMSTIISDKYKTVAVIVMRVINAVYGHYRIIHSGIFIVLLKSIRRCEYIDKRYRNT